MKSSKLILPIILNIGLASCSKKEDLPECLGSCTVVTGRLLTSGSAPLPNATVTLQWIGGSGSFGPGSHKKAVGHTDVDGHYRISGFLTDEELADGFIEAEFTPDKSKYYSIGEAVVAFHKPKRDTVYTAPDFLIPRKAAVKFIVTNPSQIPTSSSYFVDLHFAYGTHLVLSSFTGGGSTLNCSGSNTPYTLDTTGDQKIIIHQRKSSIAPDDTIFVPAGTTLTYPLTY